MCGTVAYIEEDDEQEHVCLSENSVPVDFFYPLLNYELLSGSDDILEETIMQIGCLDTLVVTLLTSSVQIEKSGNHRVNVYAETFTMLVSEAGHHFIG